MRDLIRDTPLIERERDTEKEREEKKAQQPAGFKPTASVTKHLLYRCATTAAQRRMLLTASDKLHIPEPCMPAKLLEDNTF